MAYFTLLFHFSGKNGFYTLANAVLSNFPVLSAVAKNSVVGGEFIDFILISFFFLIF